MLSIELKTGMGIGNKFDNFCRKFAKVFSKVLNSKDRYLVLYVTLSNVAFDCGYFKDLTIL